MKSSEVSIKTRSTPASLTIQGQVTKDTTVKWSIDLSWPRDEAKYTLQQYYVLQHLKQKSLYPKH